MIDLVSELWHVDAQADWIPEDIQNHDEGRARLARYLQKILELLKKGLPEVTHCYIAVTGIESGQYTPVASIGRQLADISPTPCSGNGTLAASLLDNCEGIVLINNPQQASSYRGDPSVHQKLFLQLHSDGELIGFISLDSHSTNAFSPSDVETLSRALPLLSRTVSDAVFLTRLRQLGAPFSVTEGESGLHNLYSEIVTRTSHGFGADGSILRIFNPKEGLLKVEAFYGDVPSSLLVDRRPGEFICGKVFASAGLSWTLGMPGTKGISSIGGVPLDPSDEAFLESGGARSYILMRLTSEYLHNQQDHLGTLSFYHVRPRRYSWRDIAIFKSFCQRVADTIRLHNSNIKLEEALEHLRFSSLRLTAVEMVALLGHDLGHKVFEASTNVSQYVNRATKALSKDQRSLALLVPLERAAMSSLEGAGNTLRQIRTMYQTGLDDAAKEESFSLIGVVTEIETTMEGALHRNGVVFRTIYDGKLVIQGFRTVLMQALYNLVLNSVEAIKYSKKGSTIYVRGHEDRQGESRRVVITFWDDGPGINQRDFPNPQDIFLIGRTSNTGGTGTGLPVSRSLLSQYFRADLSLDDPKKALFKITIPVPGEV